MKKALYLIFGISLCVSSLCAKDDFKATELTVGEYFSNPIGMDLSEPRFNWQLPPLRNELMQSGYRIAVATSAEDVLDDPNIWDSGFIKSSQSVNVEFPKEIKSRDKFFWAVRVWDEKGDASEWSDVAFFEAGLLDNSEWKGEWISSNKEVETTLVSFRNSDKKAEVKRINPTYFRKSFNSSKRIAKARLYATSKGIYQVYINDKKVGSDVWSPGWTDYNKRIQTQTYDVTNMLQKGANAIGAILADGWYAGHIGWQHVKGKYGSKPEFLAQLEIFYEDGSREIIVTDSSWKCSFGPIYYADIYQGQEYDANLEMSGWNTDSFNDSKWSLVDTNKIAELPRLLPMRSQAIVSMQEMPAISVKEIEKGVFIFDLGQNIVGNARINVDAIANQKIKIRYAEMLNQDGTMYTENYRSARSEDYYIPAVNGNVMWEPEFTFHGFRYVELSGLAPDAKVSVNNVIGIVQYNDMPLAGGFVCSDKNLNILQSNIQWGQRGNFFSVPTDCPQRDERLGWTGDAQVFVPTAAFNMNVNAFFSKWAKDMEDAQTAEGRFPHVAPDVLDSGGWAAWSDAGVICPYEMYLAYGDVKILRENYESMKKWVEFMKNNSTDLIRENVGFGDWLRPPSKAGVPQASHDLIGTAYFARCADILAEIALVLGKDEDGKYFKELSQNVKKAFCKKFVSEDGTVATNTQTAYLLALGFDVLPEDLREKSFAKLLISLEKEDYHLNTGFVGTPLLNLVLTRFGRADLAYEVVLKETYPSWIYSIKQGATTMWERWDSFSHEKGFGDAGMNSFNHYAYGAIGQWMYKDVAGLWYDTAAYKNIIFAPNLTEKLSWASAWHNTPYGYSMSSWKLGDGIMEWTVVIPPNSTGTIVFPTKDIRSICINEKLIDTKILDMSGKFPVLKTLPSGTYNILLKPSEIKFEEN